MSLEERHVLQKAQALAAYRSQAGRPYTSEDVVFRLQRSEECSLAYLMQSFEVVR